VGLSEDDQIKPPKGWEFPLVVPFCFFLFWSGFLNLNSYSSPKASGGSHEKRFPEGALEGSVGTIMSLESHL